MATKRLKQTEDDTSINNEDDTSINNGDETDKLKCFKRSLNSPHFLFPSNIISCPNMPKHTTIATHLALNP